MVTIRYIVDDVERAIAFYRDLLAFEVETHPAPGFAALSRGDLRLCLNAPGAGGAGRAGGSPEPGGWNRFQLQVEDLDATVKRLTEDGATFRDGIVTGKGGHQILLEDPSGNPIELFQPPGP
jgi:catechol 2,3-dioxygenase-like lactoylglutathione lyase family enzyme